MARERLWNSGVPVRAVFLEPPELMRSQMIKKTARGDLASVWEKTQTLPSAQACGSDFDTTIEGFDPGSE